MKHLEQTEKENVFASYYNIGISHWLLGNYDKALEYFKKAYDKAKSVKEQDFECFSTG